MSLRAGGKASRSSDRLGSLSTATSALNTAAGRSRTTFFSARHRSTYVSTFLPFCEGSNYTVDSFTLVFRGAFIVLSCCLDKLFTVDAIDRRHQRSGLHRRQRSEQVRRRCVQPPYSSPSDSSDSHGCLFCPVPRRRRLVTFSANRRSTNKLQVINLPPPRRCLLASLFGALIMLPCLPLMFSSALAACSPTTRLCV